jgi:NitT/TauT family transport system permease protein
MKNKFLKRISNFIVKRALFLLGFVLLWEIIYIIEIFPPLVFPSARAILSSLITGITQQSLLLRAGRSLSIIFQGLFLGFAISLILMGLTRTSRFCKNIIVNLITYLNPIPGMAILPLSLVWFGLGRNSIIFVLLHSVVWGLLINLMAGLDSIPNTQREVGKNMGLSNFRMLIDIDIPACMPYIIAGIKQAFARAWRTVIAVEAVAGVVLANAGLGWLITRQRSMIDIPGLFSTLIIIIIVGVILEDIAFKAVENSTVKKWGMMK